MILWLLGDWIDSSALNLFRYLTTRTGASIMTSLALSFMIGPYLIRWLGARQLRQPIRDDGPAHHLIEKAGTPTMGGLMILTALSVSVLLWADLSNPFIQIILPLILGFGLLGLVDDGLKISSGSSKGVKGRVRLLLEAALALAAAYGFMSIGAENATSLAVPFFKDVLIPLGFFFPVFVVLVIVGTSNGVNLTDGLDGLAIMPVMIAAASFGLIAYLVGNAVFADYLQVHYVRGAGELAVLCGAMIGAGLGFLWFNAPPARIFMGDTGALALGAALGAISIATKHELVLVVIGGLFVIETLSVIVQVVSFKLIGRRVFLMAPFHHHLEKKGWSEATIVIRLWIIAFVLALIGLATLKLR